MIFGKRKRNVKYQNINKQTTKKTFVEYFPECKKKMKSLSFFLFINILFKGIEGQRIPFDEIQ